MRQGDRSAGSLQANVPARPAPPSVSAVVLTHRRPRLATTVVRTLIEQEGFSPDRVVVVVNGHGGLDDAALESTIRLIRLPHNLGPAGGFRAGMEEAFADPSVHWAYLCEDDIGLFDLPTPRLAALVGRAECRDRLPGSAVGAVAAFGRQFVGRGAHTVNFVPSMADSGECGLAPVDVASWGATLLSRRVFDAGILPDQVWFFGLEDFDFYCRVRQGGFEVLVDTASAQAVAAQQSTAGRVGALARHRPTDAREPWRSYYHARNSILMARRHGRLSWHLWHVAYMARRMQKASGSAERTAILRGLRDGMRGRFGENPDYGRTVGEHAGEGKDPGSPDD